MVCLHFVRKCVDFSWTERAAAAAAETINVVALFRCECVRELMNGRSKGKIFADALQIKLTRIPQSYVCTMFVQVV